MKTLPADVVTYKKTPAFTQDTIPKGLLRRHTTKAGSWGKIWGPTKVASLVYQRCNQEHERNAYCA